ncbi:MAG: glycoside hydrolase family 9 protein [Verrucomicrobia bacterium]|nr:glycoside hydrolase family 9 protein [Verrucomicrobiota bacterium]
MKLAKLFGVTGSLVLAWATMAGEARMPLPIAEETGASYRWLQKPVLEFRILDDMESDAGWSHRGFGRMEFTSDRFQSGTKSLRLMSPTKGDEPGSTVGRPFGEAVARRQFAGEDWRDYNRLSFWVYPHLPGFNVISMLVKLYNEGAVSVPDSYHREGLHFFLLQPDQWNRVVWEIPHLARDRVTAVEFVYRLQGNEPGATEWVQFDLDRLELQRVEADVYEGWAPAPGRIAYSQAGYLPGSAKTAVMSGGAARRFEVIRADDRKVVFSGRIRERTGTLGTLQLLDFSEVRTPGRYYLEVGGLRTPEFEIGAEIWRESILQTLNFFYTERCGTEIPGIHGVCHQDWRAVHEGITIFINGGWHDAGDLSQGLVNTAEATQAMFALAESVRAQDPELAARLIEEGRWGLEWVLKTRFPDGQRMTWATMDFWTDGQLGNVDDVLGEVRQHPFDLSVAASAEAVAARVLAGVDPELARVSLAQAREDWASAMAVLGNPNLEVAAAAALAGIELHRATGETAYAERAIELARGILESQERERKDWSLPLSGFFYTDPRRERLLHYSHRGHEQAPVVVLAALCELFPEHPDWMGWYAAVVRHSEYLRAIAGVTEPYGMLPASVYDVNESEQAQFREQVRNGIRLDDRHYLRMFPVWFELRGNSGTLLSQAKALSTAARLRRHAGLGEVVARQLEWHMGRNPFCQSLMFGVGHDYAPQYTAMSGDLSGSLPVGVQTRANADLPYWPMSNCYNYREVWVHPSSRWLWIQADLQTPPPITRVRGMEVTEVRTRTGRDGRVRIEARVRGEGRHRLSLRTANLSVESPEQTVELRGRRMVRVRWETRILSPREDWVAVVVPDGDVAARIEVR